MPYSGSLGEQLGKKFTLIHGNIRFNRRSKSAGFLKLHTHTQTKILKNVEEYQLLVFYCQHEELLKEPMKVRMIKSPEKAVRLLTDLNSSPGKQTLETGSRNEGERTSEPTWPDSIKRATRDRLGSPAAVLAPTVWPRGMKARI